MNNTQILLQACADIFEVEVSELDESSTQETVPGWDSLNMVRLVAELEAQFGVQFDLMEVAEFKSIGAIKDLLAAKGVSFA